MEKVEGVDTGGGSVLQKCERDSNDLSKNLMLKQLYEGKEKMVQINQRRQSCHYLIFFRAKVIFKPRLYLIFNSR